MFHSALLLVRGIVDALGPRRTVVGAMAWNLKEVVAARRDLGPQATLDLLGRTAPASPQRTLADGTASARLHRVQTSSPSAPTWGFVAA